MPKRNYVQPEWFAEPTTEATIATDCPVSRSNPNQSSGVDAVAPRWLASETTDDLLDQSSLNTVLDMLVVIDSLEELALLETLTNAQKRQVWTATPEAVRIRLKQLRTPVALLPGSLHVIEDSLENESSPDSHESDLNSLEDDISLSEFSVSLESCPASIDPLLNHGDWVVLKAKPKLTASELTAIWEVVEIQGEYARIKTKSLGTHLYPVNWMIVYPKPIETGPTLDPFAEDDF